MIDYERAVQFSAWITPPTPEPTQPICPQNQLHPDVTSIPWDHSSGLLLGRDGQHASTIGEALAIISPEGRKIISLDGQRASDFLTIGDEAKLTSALTLRKGNEFSDMLSQVSHQQSKVMIGDFNHLRDDERRRKVKRIANGIIIGTIGAGLTGAMGVAIIDARAAKRKPITIDRSGEVKDPGRRIFLKKLLYGGLSVGLLVTALDLFINHLESSGDYIDEVTGCVINTQPFDPDADAISIRNAASIFNLLLESQAMPDAALIQVMGTSHYVTNVIHRSTEYILQFHSGETSRNRLFYSFLVDDIHYCLERGLSYQETLMKLTKQVIDLSLYLNYDISSQNSRVTLTLANFGFSGLMPTSLASSMASTVDIVPTATQFASQVLEGVNYPR